MDVPCAEERVYYFPQGHMEQVWRRGSKKRSCDLEERVAWAAEHEGEWQGTWSFWGMVRRGEKGARVVEVAAVEQWLQGVLGRGRPLFANNKKGYPFSNFIFSF